MLQLLFPTVVNLDGPRSRLHAESSITKAHSRVDNETQVKSDTNLRDAFHSKIRIIYEINPKFVIV